MGGIGVSTVDAECEIYKLSSVAAFLGTYGDAATASPSARPGGDLWMRNESGTIMHLKAKHTGLTLRLGGDAVPISMTQWGSRQSESRPDVPPMRNS